MHQVLAKEHAAVDRAVARERGQRFDTALGGALIGGDLPWSCLKTASVRFQTLSTMLQRTVPTFSQRLCLAISCLDYRSWAVAAPT